MGAPRPRSRWLSSIGRLPGRSGDAAIGTFTASSATAAGYREPGSDPACREGMRVVLVAALLAVSCVPSRDDLGGYVNGICEPTTRRDAQAVATTTGQFGVVGSTSVTPDDDVLVVVWRNGGPATPLAVVAHRLDPRPATRVTWAVGGSGSGSPRGDGPFPVGLEPRRSPRWWRS